MRSRGIGVAVVAAAGLAVALLIRWQGVQLPPPAAAPVARGKPPRSAAADRPAEDSRTAAPIVSPETATRPLSVAEKSARVEKINRDYEEIRAKAAADYSAAGNNFPGGLNAFLRQLALLEREKRADLAAVLNPRELEDLELRETLAGKQVQRLLGGTDATDEQKRAAFRLQREFDERFSLTFDLTPKMLLERELVRHQMQEQIRTVLGDALFANWLRGEGPDYAGFVAFAAEQGLSADVPLHLWRAKNEFIRRRLELAAQSLPGEQMRGAQNALARDIETRVLGIVGPAAMVPARREILGWLPLR